MCAAPIVDEAHAALGEAACRFPVAMGVAGPPERGVAVIIPAMINGDLAVLSFLSILEPVRDYGDGRDARENTDDILRIRGADG